MHTVYLGLGSNLGDRESQLRQAIEKINKLVGPVVRQSAFLESEPWGFDSDNRFLNAAVCCETTLTPHQLLRTTQKIERLLGKRSKHATEHVLDVKQLTPIADSLASNVKRPTYHDRPIDIDILLYDDVKLDTPKLKIPHPRMWERDFVMIPLREILL